VKRGWDCPGRWSFKEIEMEMATGMELGTRAGNGYDAGNDVEFNAGTMQPLVQSMSKGLKELLPIEDRPAYYMLWISAQLRDFMRAD
jgi:hypothetical protein